MTPDEVRMLDNQYALLFIRGERPVKDLKYSILKHPLVALSADGRAKPYKHGEADKAKNTIELSPEMLPSFDTEQQNSDYAFCSARRSICLVMTVRRTTRRSARRNQRSRVFN